VIIGFAAQGELQAELSIEIHGVAHVGDHETDRIEIGHGGIVPDGTLE
jgi:hypothetical protein